MKNKQPSVQVRVRNLGFAVIAGQAGCATLIIVIGALLIGLWLDSQMGQRGPFTFGLLILSVPLSLYVMMRIALAAINRIDPHPLIRIENSDPTTDESEEVDFS